jgi:NADH:ubiquinone oxidoreductase subunit 5 (subunit L)/multisubunit Na+/H+ antiporter MnhA subunit
MTIPLIVLAILATIGGFVGIGPAFRFIGWGEHPGGRVNISNWMDPVIWNPVTHEFGKHATAEHSGGPAQEETTEAAVPTEHAASTAGPYGNVHSTLAQSVEHTVHSELATEWIFVVISLIAAGIGMGLGYVFYLKDTRLPDIWAQRLRPLYTASYNKYWVDEFYGWAITRRTMDAARAVYAFDSRVVDGAVNGLAALGRVFSRIVGGIDKYLVDGLVNTIAAFIIRLMSPLFRAAQTGFTQNYALVMVLGLMLAVVLLFWPDIMARLR